MREAGTHQQQGQHLAGVDDDRAGFVDDDTVNGTVRNLQRWLSLNRQDYDRMSARAQACFASRLRSGRLQRT